MTTVRLIDIFVVKSGQGFTNIRIFEHRCCFCTQLLFEIVDSTLNKWPHCFNHNPSWKGINLFIFLFCPFFGRILNRDHKWFEIVFPINELWYFGRSARILGRFSLFIKFKSPVADHVVMISGTIFEYRIVARPIGLELRSSIWYYVLSTILWHIQLLPEPYYDLNCQPSLVATSADSIPSSYLVRITIAPIGTTFRNLQWRRY